MAFLSRALCAHLAAHYGVTDRATLVRLGVTYHELDGFLRNGMFVGVHTGVYRLGTTPETFLGQCRAACLADSELVISSTSAARLWHFKHTGKPAELFATVAHDRTPVSVGVILRRSNQLIDEDIVQRDDGIRLTSPPRTWFDRARDMNDHYFEALTEHVLNHHCSTPILFRFVRRLSGRGRPGSARVRRVMSQRAAWQKPADSTLEFEVLKAFEMRGVEFVRQHALQLPNGVRIHLDGADPTIRFGIEVDHHEFHGGREATDRDGQRDRKAARMGWQVVRITDTAWNTRREEVLDDLIAIYLAHGGRIGQLRPAS